MADQTMARYRQKLIQELGHLAAREEGLSKRDFRAALHKVAAVLPGTSQELYRFGEFELKVTPGTIRRWMSDGEPPPALVRAVILARLRQYLIDL